MTTYKPNPRYGRVLMAQSRRSRKVSTTAKAAGILFCLSVAYGGGALLPGSNDGYALMAAGLALASLAVVLASLAGRARQADRIARPRDSGDSGSTGTPLHSPTTSVDAPVTAGR
jgi:hypothetical protein